jgi:hypothetical protein
MIKEMDGVVPFCATSLPLIQGCWNIV